MEEVKIYKFQLESIKEALRVTANIHGSRTTLETCHDRMVVQAEQYAINALNGEKDKRVKYGVRIKNDLINDDKKINLDELSDLELIKIARELQNETFDDDSIIRKLTIQFFGGDSVTQMMFLALKLLPIITDRMSSYSPQK